MQKGLLMGLAIALAIGCGVLGTLLVVDEDEAESPRPAQGEPVNQEAAAQRDAATVENEFGSALSGSDEFVAFSIFGVECGENDEVGREWFCRVDFGPAASPPPGSQAPSPPTGTPPRDVVFRVVYDRLGNYLSWSRSADLTSLPSGPPPAAEEAPDEEPVPEGAPPLNDPGEAICGGTESPEEKRQMAVEQGLPADLCEPPE